jgi:hypothetical protein
MARCGRLSGGIISENANVISLAQNYAAETDDTKEQVGGMMVIPRGQHLKKIFAKSENKFGYFKNFLMANFLMHRSPHNAAAIIRYPCAMRNA